MNGSGFVSHVKGHKWSLTKWRCSLDMRTLLSPSEVVVQLEQPILWATEGQGLIIICLDVEQRSDNVIALDEAGKLKWRHDNYGNGTPYYCAGFEPKGLVVFSSIDERLLNAETGELLDSWRAR